MPLRVSSKSSWAGKDCRSGSAPRKGRYPVAAKQDRTYKGCVFDSKSEMNRYIHLEMAQRAGLIHGLKRQVQYSVPINGQPFCSIRFDFEYWDLGSRIVCELVTEEYKSAGTIREKDYHLRRKAAELFYGFTVRETVSI